MVLVPVCTSIQAYTGCGGSTVCNQSLSPNKAPASEAAAVPPEQPCARSLPNSAIQSVMTATVPTARRCRNTLCEFQIKKNMPSTVMGSRVTSPSCQLSTRATSQKKEPFLKSTGCPIPDFFRD